MSRKIRARLTYANVMATIAVFVALGGSSYAALRIGSSQIVNNSVRTQDLRNNDVRSTDVRNGTLLKRDFKSGQIPAGRQGPAGPAGSARAHVEVRGTTPLQIVAGSGTGIDSVTRGDSLGLYCVDTSFSDAKAAVASPDTPNRTAAASADRAVIAGLPPGTCPAGTTVVVRTGSIGAGGVSAGFFGFTVFVQ